MIISGIPTRKVILREVTGPTVIQEVSDSQDLNLSLLYSMPSAILRYTEPLLCVWHCTKGADSHNPLSPQYSPMRWLPFYRWKN